jgi:DNA-binding transcriptional LysR family regulator
MSDHTSFRQLEVFVAAVEAGTFRECADRLGISQASVSSHIQALEARLGGELFMRRRGATADLTERGDRTYHEVKDLLERAARLGLQTRGIRPTTRRGIVIGAHGLAARLVSHAVPHFVADHPEVNVVLEVLSFEPLVDELKSGRIDIGYFVSNGPALQLDSRRVRVEPLGLYVCPRHPLASVERAGPDELRTQASLAPPANTHLRRVIDAAILQAGLPIMPTSLESDQIDVVKQAAMLGLGAAWMFKMSAQLDIVKGHLKEVPLQSEVQVEIREAIAPRRRRDGKILGAVKYLERTVFSHSGDPRLATLERSVR